jgi:hypothetical protein
MAGIESLRLAPEVATAWKKRVTVRVNTRRVRDAPGAKPERIPGRVRPHASIAGSGYKSLEEGQRVSFESSQGQKGPQADSVRPI